MHTPSAGLLAFAGAIAAALALAACGGSGSPSSAAAGERASEQANETKFADFAKCLREHGIKAEAAPMPGGGHGLKVSPGSAHGPAAFEAAQNACARYRPAPKRINLSPQERVEHEEAVQKFAKCMREHGIKVEASTSNGGADIRIGIHGGPGSGGPNPESPGFQRAQSACQKLLPSPPGGGKGPPARGAGGPGGAGGLNASSAKGGEGAQLSSGAGK